MSILEYNGSALIAMVGKNCFAIASDRRFGVQLHTIATDFQKIYRIHDRVFLGLSGLATDAQTLYQRLVFRHKLYQLREDRDMKPQTFANLVSAILYEKRFGPYFCQPVIAGLGDEDKPFICRMDSIGAKELAKDFVVAGTASESLYGACEAMFKPDMESDELFETVSQALLSSVDRDCLSGWGGHVYVVTPTEVKEELIFSRLNTHGPLTHLRQADTEELSRTKMATSMELSRTKMATSMELYPEEMEVPGHPHSPFRLRVAEKPCYCGGCKEKILALESSYHCDRKEHENQKCEFYLHKECAPFHTDMPLWLGLINCNMTFHQDPKGENMVCDACGRDVKGFFYQGSSIRKSYHLHPCCAKLDFKMRNVNLGDVVFDLKEKSAIKCLKCKNQGHSKDFRSWVYVSRCGKYCFHVSCMKESADLWMEKGNNLLLCSDQAGSSRGVQRQQSGKQALYFLDMAIEMFTGVTFTIFGIPTRHVLPFVEWTRMIW